MLFGFRNDRATGVRGWDGAWRAITANFCGHVMIANMSESFGEAYGTRCKAEVDPHLFLDVTGALFGSRIYANYGK